MCVEVITPNNDQSASPRPRTHRLYHGRRSVERIEESVCCSQHAEQSCRAHNQTSTGQIGQRCILKQKLKKKNQII